MIFPSSKKLINYVFFVNDINNENKIIKEKDGDSNYVLNRIYLLRKENEDKSHYVYIKSISRLSNLSNNSTDVDKELCPYCNLKFQSHKFETHIKHVIK